MHFKSFIILIISVLEHEDYDRIEVFIISKIVTGHLGFSRLSNWFSLFRTLNYGVTKKTEDSSNNLCSCVLLCWLQCWILLESVHQTGNVSNWRLDYLKCWAFANVFHAWFNQIHVANRNFCKSCFSGTSLQRRAKVVFYSHMYSVLRT